MMNNRKIISGSIKTKHLILILVTIFLFLLVLVYVHVNGRKALLQEGELAKEKIVRQPVFAGAWYPGNAEELKATLDEYFSSVEEQEINGKIRALIVPHAGYAYSGRVAATGFKHLKDDYETVIIMGPSHRYALSGASIMNFTHYATPLGEVKLSPKAEKLWKEKFIKPIPEADKEEHSIEIELPFLQEKLRNFELVPIVVGMVDVYNFSQALTKVIDEKTLIVVSADLSHYHPYDEAVRLDTYCTDAITRLDINGLSQCEIDAPWAVASLMLIARQKGWKAKLLIYKNSGDVTGDKKSGVVGYSAIVFYEEELTSEEKDFLIKLARSTLEDYLREGKRPVVITEQLTPNLKKIQGCFVTLHKNGQLRGCIGHILPQEELYNCVIDNAINAALHDPRFKPVTQDELKDITLDISVLSVPSQLDYSSPEDLLDKLRPLVDGVVLKQGWNQATYLPQVWEQIPDKKEFLSSLCAKAGLKTDCWKEKELQVYTYQALVFAEGEN